MFLRCDIELPPGLDSVNALHRCRFHLNRYTDGLRTQYTIATPDLSCYDGAVANKKQSKGRGEPAAMGLMGVRFPGDDRALIESAAKRMSLGASTFVRVAAVEKARAILGSKS